MDLTPKQWIPEYLLYDVLFAITWITHSHISLSLEIYDHLNKTWASQRYQVWEKFTGNPHAVLLRDDIICLLCKSDINPTSQPNPDLYPNLPPTFVYIVHLIRAIGRIQHLIAIKRAALCAPPYIFGTVELDILETHFCNNIMAKTGANYHIMRSNRFGGHIRTDRLDLIGHFNNYTLDSLCSATDDCIDLIAYLCNP